MFDVCHNGCQECGGQRGVGQCHRCAQLFADNISNCTAEDRPVQLADAPLVIVDQVRAVTNRVADTVADQWHQLEGASRSPAAVEALSPKLKPYSDTYDGFWPPPPVVMSAPPIQHSFETPSSEQISTAKSASTP